MRILRNLLGYLCILSLVGCYPVEYAPETLAATCTSCQTLANTLYSKVVNNDTDAEIVSYVTSMCTALEVETISVCTGVKSKFSSTYLYVIRGIADNPKAICALLVDDCNVASNPMNAVWSVPIPGNKPTVHEPPLPSSDKPKLRVLQLSDLHVDNDYQIGSEVQCTWSLCCRPESDNSEGIVTDSVKIIEPAGKWGSVGRCDAPYWLLENMLQNIASKHRDIDYVVLSGDLVSHTSRKTYSRVAHVEKVKNISATLAKYLPGWKVYFSVGNHEGVPQDFFAPHYTPDEFHMDWLYDAVAEGFQSTVSDTEAIQTIKYRGCFVQQLYPGLRLISLNSIYNYKYNAFTYVNETDPDGTMSWLVDQLSAAEKAGDKVQIVAHVPSGTSVTEGWAINYYKAINRFESTVVAQFFGHTHTEAISMFYENPYSSASRPTGVLYMSPSMTTYSTSNPAYRIYTIDGNYKGSSFQILDFEDYFLNLTVANAHPEASPVWEPLFTSVKKEYGLSSVRPSEWNKMIDRMESENSLLQKYYHNMHRRNNMKSCGSTCKASLLCSARTSHQTDALCAKDVTRNLMDPLYGNDKRVHIKH